MGLSCMRLTLHMHTLSNCIAFNTPNPGRYLHALNMHLKTILYRSGAIVRTLSKNRVALSIWRDDHLPVHRMSNTQNSSIMLAPCTCVEKLHTRVVNYTLLQFHTSKFYIPTRVLQLVVAQVCDQLRRYMFTKVSSGHSSNSVCIHPLMRPLFLEYHITTFGTQQYLVYSSCTTV